MLPTQNWYINEILAKELVEARLQAAQEHRLVRLVRHLQRRRPERPTASSMRQQQPALLKLHPDPKQPTDDPVCLN